MKKRGELEEREGGKFDRWEEKDTEVQRGRMKDRQTHKHPL